MDMIKTPGEHQACRRVWTTNLKNGAFAPCQWKDIAGSVKGGLAP